MLQGFTSATLLLCLVASSLASNRTFPDEFLIGSGTAAYQVEGGWDSDGKGPSMWDVFIHDNNLTNADIAANHYEKWEEDVEHIANLGLDFYRFSISWPRILPDGTLNSYNQAGVDFYLNLILALKAAGVEPMVTLYHWDMPEHLSKLGGFLNPQFVDYFEDYARLIFTLFAPYVTYWGTFNEPFIICNFGYGGTDYAPGLNLTGDGLYQCGYVLLLAHARAYKVYDNEFKSTYNGSIGIVFNSDWRQAATNSTEDAEAQERAMTYSFGWFANPVYNGNWPEVMIERIANRSALEGLTKSRLPTLTDEEIAYINGTHDYLAFNTYGTRYVSMVDEYNISTPSYLYDLGVSTTARNVDAAGLRKILNWINDEYAPESIIITENGLATTNDTYKQEFLKNHLNSVLDAIYDDGINVIAYSWWALMDTFEWAGFYTKKYGLIEVDFDDDNRTRTWRGSAYWYHNLTSTRCLED